MDLLAEYSQGTAPVDELVRRVARAQINEGNFEGEVLLLRKGLKLNDSTVRSLIKERASLECTHEMLRSIPDVMRAKLGLAKRHAA